MVHPETGGKLSARPILVYPIYFRELLPIPPILYVNFEVIKRLDAFSSAINSQRILLDSTLTAPISCDPSVARYRPVSFAPKCHNLESLPDQTTSPRYLLLHLVIIYASVLITFAILLFLFFVFLACRLESAAGRPEASRPVPPG